MLTTFKCITQEILFSSHFCTINIQNDFIYIKGNFMHMKEYSSFPAAFSSALISAIKISLSMNGIIIIISDFVHLTFLFI